MKICLIDETGAGDGALSVLAARWGLEQDDDNPMALALTTEHLELRKRDEPKLGGIFVDFVGGAMAHRRKFGGGRGEAVAKAVGIKGDYLPDVVDATAGLGRDAFVLASVGCRVRMLERNPVVAALLFAGRAGSALTAEIGLMRATEQLSSMEMMAVDPLRRVISPRFWAGVISLPLLTIIFVAVGIWGGALVGVSWKGIDGGFFWTAMQNAVDWRMDLVNCLIKSLVFAITVTWIALFNGYDAIPTSAGISRATTRTVVHASLAVLGLDFVLTALMFGN